MRTILYKKLLYALSYMLCALLIEFFTFNVMGLGAFPEMFKFDLLFIGLIALIIFIVPSFRAEAIIIIVLLLAQSLISFVNQAMNNDSMLRNIFTFDQLNVAGAAANVFNNDYVSWPFLIGLVAIILGEIALLIIFKKIKVKSQLNVKVQVAFLMSFLFVATIIGSYYGKLYSDLNTPVVNSEEAFINNDDKKLFSNVDYSLKLKAFKKFGTFAFYYKNLTNTLKEPDNINDSLKNANNYLKDGELTQLSPLGGVYKDNNLIVIMMESAEWHGFISPELTPTMYALSQYGITNHNYISKNKTNQSEAISMLGSYPAKTDIQAEFKTDVKKGYSSYSFALPYVLKNSNYNTTYFHNNTKEFYNRTETHQALGFEKMYFWENMTTDNTNVSQDKFYVNNKYKTTNDFYDFESDYEFLNGISENKLINPSQRFMSFYTSMCMHGNYHDLVDFIEENNLPYNWDYVCDDANTQTWLERKFKNSSKTNDFFCKYYPKITWEYFENTFKDSLAKLGYFDENGDVVNSSKQELHNIYLRFKQYQAACMDFDAGVNSLICNLNESNQLANTTILFFADHDAYYHNMNFDLRGYTLDEFYNIDLYKVPFILYDGSMHLKIPNYENLSSQEKISVSSSENLVLNSFGEGYNITRWMSSYDIAPTLLDMFGYSINSNLYQGTSIFGEQPDSNRSIFYSFESGVCNDEMFRSGEGIYFYVDADKEVYKIENYSLTDLVYAPTSKISPSSEFTQKLIGKLMLFDKQLKTFTEKQEVLETIYDFKFFSFSGINNTYDFADINKNIVLVK